MKVVCISASNMKNAAENGVSTRVCSIIDAIIRKDPPTGSAQVEIVRLVEAEISPCSGCGECFKTGLCTAGDGFNQIYEKIAGSDALFIVSPHYAPIPANFCALLEKMEQIAYLPWFHNHNHNSRLYKKPAGIIAHGGGSYEKALLSYKKMVLDTISNALETAQMVVVGADEDRPNGIVFPVKEVHKDATRVFPVQIYDWEDIESRITPLVKKVIEKVDKS
jgi:multimeric flavodoxin WrbA